MQAAMTFGLSAEFSEVIADALGQIGDPTGRGSVFKGSIHPQCPQHFDQMGFAGAIEPAHPNGRLLGLVDILEVGFEDVRHPFFVLAITNERFQFVAKNRQRMAGCLVVDACHPLVDQLPGGWILLINVTILH